MRKYAGIAIALLFFAFSISIFIQLIPYDSYEGSDYHYKNPINGGVANESIPTHYIKETKNETGAVNALGEVTVLFTAATGISFLLYQLRKKTQGREANLITKEGSKLVLPFALLTGAYIFIHGHLTPGGGFPGGSVIASGFLLMLLAYPKFFVNEKKLSYMESISGSIFVIIGLLGLLFATAFLQNFIPVGKPGHLFSAGIIPLIYIAIGFKVGSELSSIVQRLKEVGE